MILHRATCILALIWFLILAGSLFGLWHFFGVKGLINGIMAIIILTLVVFILIERSDNEYLQ